MCCTRGSISRQLLTKRTSYRPGCSTRFASILYIFCLWVYIRISWGSAVAWWLMPRTPDPEVGGSSPTRVKLCFVLEQGIFTPQKVLVIPRKQWLHLNMTEKLFTGTLRINQSTNQPTSGYPAFYAQKEWIKMRKISIVYLLALLLFSLTTYGSLMLIYQLGYMFESFI